MQCPKITYLVLLTVFFGVSAKAQQIPQSEFQALVALYNATDGPNWTNNDGWNTTTNNVHEGGWFGVTVENGHVVELDISDGFGGLNGTLPSELGDLTELRRLVILSNDDLRGEIPAELGNLSKLTSLSLSTNSLTGEIPVELGNLSQLTLLYLANNELTGEIPSELGGLSQLQVLFLSSNKLTGEIPTELANLDRLTTLYLGENNLTGEIPAELGNLKSITDLNLANNNLSGEIPAELGDLSGLRYLHLHGNELTGEIPAELGNLSQLDWLRLLGNELTGEIPVELSNLSNLSWLELTDNQLSGTIPQAIIDMANGGNRTTRIYLQENAFTGIGTLPATFFADFEIQNNFLDFDDLAGNVGNLLPFRYSPQRFPLDPTSYDLNEGGAFSLTVDPAGQNLTYLWKKNYLGLGLDAPTISVSSATIQDAGVYYCIVTSTDLPDLSVISDQVSVSVDGLLRSCGEDEGLPLGLIWRGEVLSAQTNGSEVFQGVVNDSVTIVPTGEPNRYTVSAHIAGAYGFDAPGDFYADCEGSAYLFQTYSLGIANDGGDYGGESSSYDPATHTLRLSSYTFSAFPLGTTFAMTEFTPYVAPPMLSNRSVETAVASSATVGTLSTLVDPNSDHTRYALVSGEGDKDNALFQIVGAELRLAPGHSVTEPETLSVRVRAIHDARPYVLDSVFAIVVTEGSVSALTDTPDASLTLFPNPANNALQVRIHHEGGKAVEYSVYDQTGRKFLTETMPKTPKAITLKLDLTDLPAGLYLLEVMQSETRLVRRFVKQ